MSGHNKAGEWTTLLDPERCVKAYGTPLPWHKVCFLPISENILGRHVGLLIPECELQNVYCLDGKEPLSFINRPKVNKNVRLWLKHACKIATEDDCPISFSCDTREQADWAAKAASRKLPNHKRIALERMYDAATRTLRGLA